MSETKRLWLVAMPLCFAACTRYLPPPRAPMPSAVNVEVPPAPPNTAQVVVDVEDGPAQAYEITGSVSTVSFSRYGVNMSTEEFTNPLCTTPCVPALLPGPHRLRFSSLADSGRTTAAMVMFAPGPPSVVRVALGTDRPRSWVRVTGAIGISVGPLAALGGVIWGPIASGLSGEGWPTGAVALTVGGSVLTAGAIALLVALPTIFQEGAVTQFADPSRASADNAPLPRTRSSYAAQ